MDLSSGCVTWFLIVMSLLSKPKWLANLNCHSRTLGFDKG